MAELKAIIELVEQYSLSTWLTLIGLVIFYLSIREHLTDGAQEIKIRFLVVGIIIVVFAQGATIANSFTERKHSVNRSFEKLKTNSRVKLGIRLLAYNPRTEKYLSLDQLKTLGKPEDHYVFIADYEEVINCTVKEAVFKMGGNMNGKTRASAVIFPIGEKLFPANVRGLLQVVKKVDELNKSDQNYRAFDFANNLSEAEFANLDDEGITSWQWKEYSSLFRSFSRAVENLRTGNYSALNYIGNLHKDWSEFGYSKIVGFNEDNQKTFQLTDKKNGTTYNLTNFGARAFFIPNYKINEIDNRILIDFTNLETDKIPDLTGKFGKLPTK